MTRTDTDKGLRHFQEAYSENQYYCEIAFKNTNKKEYSSWDRKFTFGKENPEEDKGEPCNDPVTFGTSKLIQLLTE